MELKMEDWLDRTELLIGQSNIQKLKDSHVIVFGCGGVGSYAIEGFVRAGIGYITIVDKDIVDVTNINRQLIADTTTVGQDKVTVCEERLLKINPNLHIETFKEFAEADNLDKFISKPCNYIVDAIDTISSKLALVEYAYQHHIPIISCMGTGNKLNPFQFEIADIYQTSICPLAKTMRKELRKRNITHLKVLYSKEEPIHYEKSGSSSSTIASISFVPSVAGLMIAGEVVKDLMK